MEDITKLTKLSKTVYDEAERNAMEIIDAAIQKKNAEIENQKLKLDAEINEYIKHESAKIKADTINSLMHESIESRRLILAAREAYIKKVFDIAAEKLKNFTHGTEYEPYMKELYGKAAEMLGEINVIKVSHTDIDLMKRIAPAKIIEDSKEINLGGFIAENGRLIVDFTFDKRFRTETERFVLTSAFVTDK